MALPSVFGEQIDASGSWGPISPVLRCGERGTPLFLDVETSGLSAGSGSAAFLVGLGRLVRLDGDCLVRVEQYFLSDLGAEEEFTAHLHRAIRGEEGDEAGETRADQLYVTYNGASFDLPVLRTRAVLARRPFPEYGHLDLLPLTRRLYAPVIGACRLTLVERHVLGRERYNDIPGSEVPERYLHFLRTGQTEGLLQVLDHHFQDIANLVHLGLHLNDLVQHYRGPSGEKTCGGVEPDEAALLRVLLERGDAADRDRASSTLRRRVHDEAASGERDERWLNLARLNAHYARRNRNWSELHRTLRAIREVGGTLRDAVDLAIQLEHRTRDYATALEVVREAGQRFGWDAALRHREARLNRRISRVSS